MHEGFINQPYEILRRRPSKVQQLGVFVLLGAVMAWGFRTAWPEVEAAAQQVHSVMEYFMDERPVNLPDSVTK